MVDLSPSSIQSLLFALFAGLTAILAAILGPTYDGLLVPELTTGALYPTVGGAGFLGNAASFSSYLVAHLVDPAVPLVALAIGILYLARASVPTLAGRAESLLPKLVFAIVLANFTLPVAGALLGLAGAGYPVVAGFDGGAWTHWVDLGGVGMLAFSWDNGLLAFLLTLVLFGLVLMLALLVALRDALLAVLLVLLPMVTLLYPVPSLAPLAKKAWILFGQLAFLPWVVVVPLELAVGTPSVLLLVGYLTVALAAPGLLSFAGGQLASVGFASAGSTVAAEVRRGQPAAPSAVGAVLSPSIRAGTAAGGAGAAVGSAARTASRAAAPLALPLFVGEMAGQGLLRLFRHGAPGGGTRRPLASLPAVHGSTRGRP